MVSFGVTAYTLHRSAGSQRRQAQREQLDVVYVPLNEAVGDMMLCASEPLCGRRQAAAAYRQWSKAQYVAIFLGLDAVAGASETLDETFITITNARVSRGHAFRAVRMQASKHSVALS